VTSRDSILREVKKAEKAIKEKKTKEGRKRKTPSPSSSEEEVDDSEDELAHLE
jgi:hypothetical protein